MRYENQEDFPDAIDHKGRWCKKDGKLYKSVQYHGGFVRWVAEGTAMHSGPSDRVTNTYRLRYRGLEALVERLRGGPLQVCGKREGEEHQRCCYIEEGEEE